jgi:acetyl-CoA C-acetyltransferase
MTEAFLYDHVRTPRGRGRADGALHEVPPIALATQVLQALRDRSSLDTGLVDDVILGCVSPVGDQGSGIGRVAALNAGYADSVSGYQLNRFCASGLEAVNSGAAMIMAGQSDAIVAGGVESMSRVPIASDGGAWYGDPAVARATYFVPQGVGADLIATLQGYTRDDVDRYALRSQQRAASAAVEGRASRSLVLVRDVMGEILLSHDEYPRPNTTLADLSALKPAFREAGEAAGFAAVAMHRYPAVEAIRYVHTAGNSSGIVDGAAGVLLGNRAFGKRAGLAPRARIRAFASIGSEPAIMLTGPALATRKALKRARMSLADIDLFEVNEAFAAVVMRFMDDTGVGPEKVNVNGGAIALGHPLGATGAMILGTALDELERQGLSTALVTLCVGAGMGTATIIERL